MVGLAKAAFIEFHSYTEKPPEEVRLKVTHYRSHEAQLVKSNCENFKHLCFS